MATNVKEIAGAILSTLKAKPLGVYYIEEVEAQTTTFEEFLNRVQLPSVAVGYLGSDFQAGDESGDLQLRTGSFAVIVIHSDIRGYVMSMNETNGIQDILAGCAAALQGQSLGLALASGLRPISERPLVSVPGRIAWQQVWECEFYH